MDLLPAVNYGRLQRIGSSELEARVEWDKAAGLTGHIMIGPGKEMQVLNGHLLSILIALIKTEWNNLTGRVFNKITASDQLCLIDHLVEVLAMADSHLL